jgi:hypothetical protein
VEGNSPSMPDSGYCASLGLVCAGLAPASSAVGESTVPVSTVVGPWGAAVASKSGLLAGSIRNSPGILSFEWGFRRNWLEVEAFGGESLGTNLSVSSGGEGAASVWGIVILRRR